MTSVFRSFPHTTGVTVGLVVIALLAVVAHALA